ncbi:MAG: hypothetical protein Fur0037_28890 [Planctomycetota bacterium]
MRRALPLILILTACSSLSREDRDRLASFQRNAKLYYEAGKIEQCLAMAERGLALDPTDYLLGSLKGMALLRLSIAESGTRQDRLLDEAFAQISAIQARRPTNRHDRYQLLAYGMVLQRLAMRSRTEADRLVAEAARLPATAIEGKIQREKADELRRLSKADYLRARDALHVLLDRGEIPLVVHKHLLEIEIALGNYDKSYEHGAEFLKQIETSRAEALRQIREATKPEWERYQRKVLEDLRDQEITVRSLLADIHFDRREFEQAARHLDAILLLDPRRSADYYNRARVLRELGRIEDAKADFRKFLATSDLPANNPKMADAARALTGQ